jgi:hypothetical protein
MAHVVTPKLLPLPTVVVGLSTITVSKRNVSERDLAAPVSLAASRVARTNPAIRKVALFPDPSASL